MLRGQDMALGGIGDVAYAVPGTHEGKRPFLFSPIEKTRPKRFELRQKRWINKIVNLTRDDLIPRQPQQPARARVGIQAVSVAIDDQNGLRRIIEDRLEQ